MNGTLTPGPRNLITDVAGLAVGNAEDLPARTGATVLLPDAPAICAVDVRGGGPGTRETDLLTPAMTVERVDAITLSGGSVFGLDAASGVVNWLASQGRGFAVGPARAPIVPSAILFDLLNGGDKDWGEAPPYPALGRAAAIAASPDFALGNAGAGMGATAGDLKGGLGSASIVWRRDGRTFTVGALAAANPNGSVLIPGSDVFWAWPFEQDGEFGGKRPSGAPATLDATFPTEARANTSLAIVATDAALSQPQAQRVAMMAQDGFARAIRPVHTPLDGDVIFALSTGATPLADPYADVGRIGMLAADCVARAVARSVYEAETLGDLSAYRDRYATS